MCAVCVWIVLFGWAVFWCTDDAMMMVRGVVKSAARGSKIGWGFVVVIVLIRPRSVGLEKE